jgi:outer membrane lipoprotein SlyB
MAAPGAIVAPKASLANNEALVDATDRPADGTAAHSTPGTPVPPKSAARTAPRDARSGTRVASTNAPRGEATSSAQAAPVCATCGVVEGVHAVTQKGQGTGLGAVAGGVVGGAVGNQMGHGNGRAAMTVLGALGGGLAGHEIEKRARSETVYDVRVRMDDGSVRTLRQKTAPAAGARVTVEGNVLHVVPATHAPA